PFSDGKRRFLVLRPLESRANNWLRVPVIATPSYPNPGRAWIRFCDRSSASIQGPHSGAAGSPEWLTREDQIKVSSLLTSKSLPSDVVSANLLEQATRWTNVS